jgi:plasmid maintenance system antidote protein VapI
MHAREALNTVIEVHNLKAVDISRLSGVDVHEISKFRNGHKDMTTSTFFKIVNALPISAKSHLLALCLFEDTLAAKVS